MDTGVAIYLLDGQQIAANNADLWDGELATPLSFNEFGHNSFGGVWTGSLANGLGAPGLELGNASSGMSVRGHTGSSNSNWMNKTTEGPGLNPEANNKFYRMYAMSSVLTVQPVPLPAAAWLFAFALGALRLARTKR